MGMSSFNVRCTPGVSRDENCHPRSVKDVGSWDRTTLTFSEESPRGGPNATEVLTRGATRFLRGVTWGQHALPLPASRLGARTVSQCDQSEGVPSHFVQIGFYARTAC